MFRTLKYFLLIFLLGSCKQNNNPETIVGIRLGLPEKSQISEAVQQGKIKTEGDRQFIDYGDLNGYITAYTTTNKDRIEIITSVIVWFKNPNVQHPNLPNDDLVTEHDLFTIRNLFEEKYGKPELYQTDHGEFDIEDRIWRNGDLEIKLTTNKKFKLLNVFYCEAYASYNYIDDTADKLYKDGAKYNEKI